MLSKQDAAVLEEIVGVEGRCMSSKRCKKCPFRSMCLPEFLNPKPPTSNQRFHMALDVICHNMVVDPNSGLEEFKESFRKTLKQNFS